MLSLHYSVQYHITAEQSPHSNLQMLLYMTTSCKARTGGVPYMCEQTGRSYVLLLRAAMSRCHEL